MFRIHASQWLIIVALVAGTSEAYIGRTVRYTDLTPRPVGSDVHRDALPQIQGPTTQLSFGHTPPDPSRKYLQRTTNLCSCTSSQMQPLRHTRPHVHPAPCLHKTTYIAVARSQCLVFDRRGHMQ